MDKRVTEFITDVAQTIIGLNLALYLQAHPKTLDTAAGFALRLRHSVESVEPVVHRFLDHGILRVRTTAPDASYNYYSLNRDPPVWNLLCLISEAYIDDPETRKQVVRLLVKLQQQRPRKNTEDSVPPPT